MDSDSEHREAPQNTHANEQAKNDLITTDDGLDQAIQRAIAQHDLEQQQLEQQQLEQRQNGSPGDAAASGGAGHPLHSEGPGSGHFGGDPSSDRSQQADAHHGGNVGLPVDLAVDHTMEMPGSPLLDAAQEKQHLQMIADELKRAATDPQESSDSQRSIKEEDDFGALGAAGGRENGSFNNPVDLEGSVSHGIEPQSRQEHRGQHEGASENASEASAGAQRDSAHSGHDLHVRTSHSGHSEAHQNGPETAARAQAAFHDSQPHSALSQGQNSAHIPPNSELLATNEAVAAYNALSAQAPPTAQNANAHLAALPLPIVPTSYMPARIQLLVSTLAVLDNLATQLLRVFAAGPYQKIIDLASSPDTPPGAAFRDLTSLFEFTKRLYSEEDPFLTVEHIAPGIWKEGEKTPSMFLSREQTIESTLRKVNLATFLAATLGTIEVGFFHLNESFLPVFCPANDLDPANSMSNMSASNSNLQSGSGYNIGERVGKVLKPQASLYLDLKTQAYISAIEAGERSREDILEDILPSNLLEILQKRRATKLLTPTELDFINRCAARKETLLHYPADQSLNEEYEWFEFLKDLFEFVSKNMGFLLWGRKGKVAPRTKHVPATPHSDEVLQEMEKMSEMPHAAQAPQDRGNKGLDEITAALLPSEIQEQQIHLRINPAITSKGPNRRPWTRQEEKALRHAMELKGTQWSVILELFGQGGRINESLKYRTQVQLKDKARNWKMFFLKSGLAVPTYLQKVTGDLEREDKSRAKSARNKKTAAAPVPTVAKRGAENTDAIDEELKKQRVE